ncbi:MAG: 16S rRNA (uracil(1498)-N(3))-methyltransferase, partial [Bacteroidales bacterium]|nr:16S rRNA (uracil(1498)-N(3))-methyltransferase [Bacteroidales bacterium]
MNLFYAPDLTSGVYHLNKDESRHCIKVLRLNTGDALHITNGRGTLIEAKLIEPDPKKCIVEILNTQKKFGGKNYRLHIAVAPTKNISRFEWFLEKATEIGIDEITPLICEHSERKVVKPERLEKILIGAMKQSLKAYLPVLNEAVNFSDFISQPFNCQKF